MTRHMRAEALPMFRCRAAMPLCQCFAESWARQVCPWPSYLVSLRRGGLQQPKSSRSRGQTFIAGLSQRAALCPRRSLVLTRGNGQGKRNLAAFLCKSRAEFGFPLVAECQPARSCHQSLDICTPLTYLFLPCRNSWGLPTSLVAASCG